jgi:SPP1 gp7 family putative phage head morphogenesis protein
METRELPEFEPDDTLVEHEMDLAQHAAWLLLLLSGLYLSRVTDLYGIVRGVDDIAQRGVLLTGSDRRKAERIVSRLDKWHRQTYRELRKTALSQMSQLVKYESGYQAEAMTNKAGRRVNPLGRRDIAGLTERSAFQGRTLGEHLDALGQASLDRVRKDLLDTLQTGGSAEELMALVRGTTENKGVTAKANDDLKRLVVTATTHASNAVRVRLVERNPDAFDRMVHVSVLDSRTSRICLSLAGKVYRVGIDKIRVPPLHFNCRSVLIFLAKGAALPNVPTADEWLRRQSKSRQDSILGDEVADLWRSGRLDLRNLVSKNLRPLSIQELKRRRPR